MAYTNDGNFQSFCHRLYGRSRLWLLDIDCLDDPALEEALERGTVASRADVLATSLHSLKGNLVETVRTGGRGRLVLPANPLLRDPYTAGLQWCPECLDDGDAFWRIEWRLAFVTICDLHDCVLADRCSDCGACCSPVRRGDLGCWKCLYDLRRHPRQLPLPMVASLQEQLLDLLYDVGEAHAALLPGWFEAHSVLSFRKMWLLMRLLSGGGKAEDLWRVVCPTRSYPTPTSSSTKTSWRVESMGVNRRHTTMSAVAWLLSDWPDAFIAACKAAGMLWSDLLRGVDERDVPYGYRTVLLENFSHPSPVRDPAGRARYA